MHIAWYIDPKFCVTHSAGVPLVIYYNSAGVDQIMVPPGLLQLLPVPESCFSSWSIDFTTDLPLSHEYNTILTCMDCITKYTILISCKMGDKTLTATEPVHFFFAHLVRYFGVP